jgi:hypothetical protein
MWTEQPSSSWGPSRWLGLLGVAVALGLAALGIGSDGGGRLLAAIAVLGLLSASGWVLIGGPALRADASGLRIRGLVRSRTLEWASIESIGADRRRRVRAVELEVEGALITVPAGLLGGAGPAGVASELRRIRALALTAQGQPG